MIPYGRQDINQTDIDEVVGVLKSDFLTQGPAVPRFEQGFAQRRHFGVVGVFVDGVTDFGGFEHTRGSLLG